MHFTQKIHHANSPEYLLRFRYYNIAVDHFSWTSERSADVGKTWVAGVHVEATRAKRQNAAGQREAIAAKVKAIQQFDYEGNRGALAMMYRELDPYTADRELVPVVHYWRGFAMWRRAINGFNETPIPGDLERDLSAAVNEFDLALQADPNFVEAMIGEGGTLGYILYLHRDDSKPDNSRMFHAISLLQTAKEIDPNNPRLLWVAGPSYWVRPVEKGGGEDKAFEAYQRGLVSARQRRAQTVDPLQPSWGEAELLMSLAWSNLHRKQPDLTAANQFARQALTQVPNWHYVRDILLPQIQKSREEEAKARPQ